MGQRKDVFIYRFLAQVIHTRKTLFIYEAEKNTVGRAPIINGLYNLNGESYTP
jgi:hypothetical protein